MDLDPNVSCPRIVRLKKDTSPPRISSSQQGRKEGRKKGTFVREFWGFGRRRGSFV
jgi:hypothetical protein